MAEELLNGVSRHLRLKGKAHESVMRELQSHLDESRYDLELSGNPPELAIQETLDRFGDPEEVASMLTDVHRRHLPKAQLVAIVTVALAGLSAWFGTVGTFASGAHRTKHPAKYEISAVTSRRAAQAALHGHMLVIVHTSLREGARGLENSIRVTINHTIRR